MADNDLYYRCCHAGKVLVAAVLRHWELAATRPMNFQSNIWWVLICSHASHHACSPPPKRQLAVKAPAEARQSDSHFAALQRRKDSLSPAEARHLGWSIRTSVAEHSFWQASH